MVKTIAWFASTAKSKELHRELFANNEAIKILDDLISSYSHSKMNKVTDSQALKVLFEFFICKEQEEFLNNFEGLQKEKYTKRIEDILFKFNLL